jgi:hypothetical protein
MFKCDECGRLTESGESQFVLIAEKRDVVYRKAKKIHSSNCKKHKSKKNYCTCVGPRKDTKGWEIVKEKKVCGDCV